MTSLLDHGFVEFVDSMGSDADIVAAARLSYQKGTRAQRSDAALLRYLWRNEHFSPFEMAEIKFHIKCPIFVARQLFRHRSAAANEMSGRYSVMPDEYYVPEIDRLGIQSTDNKQGTGEALDSEVARSIQDQMHDVAATAFATYGEWVDDFGLSRELARIQLPLSTYTEFVWKQDLRNLLHLLRLRLDPHAQYEIRVYAEAMSDIVKQLFPETWRAFEDYTLEAVTFSRMERELLASLIDLETFLTPPRPDGMSEREYNEFWKKVQTL